MGNPDYHRIIDDKDLKPEDEIPLVQVIKMERDSGSKLAYRIASCIAEATAERFAEAVSDMEPETIEEIMMRMQNADSEALVGMLQVLFIHRDHFHCSWSQK